MNFNIDDIKRAVENGHIQWSGHILTRMQQREIKIKDIINSLSSGEIIEYYEEDYPQPSCLVYGHKEGNKVIHIVCAYKEENLWLITAYYPDKEEWLEDKKTRR